MKMIGYFLIAAGFLGGSYLTVLDAEEVRAAPFVITLMTGVLGVVLARVATHQAARQEGVLTTNLGAVSEALDRLVAEIGRLNDQRDEIDVYDLRHHIDDELLEHLDDFVEARESIAHTYGLEAYATVMSHFAAAERYLNRVWSCSTDGYIDEAHTYLEKARDQMGEARREYSALGASG